MQTWQTKAHNIIARLCRQSYETANRTKAGKLRKKHVPYPVPAEAEALIDCLNRNDEQTAKALFIHNYAIGKVS